MENVDSDKPTSPSEIAPSNAQEEATPASPSSNAEQTQQPSIVDTKKEEHTGEHDVLTALPEAKKEEEPSVASAQPAQSAPSDSSSSTNPSPAPTAPTPSYVPPVKRFSAVSVNKKFLEKPSPHTGTAGGAQPTSGISTTKPTATIARPTPQSASSHLRLVTSKVTGNTLLSTSPGPGWSRPQSVTPPAPSPSNQTPPSGSHGPFGASQNVAPGRPTINLKPKVDGAPPVSRPAWRNIGSSVKPNIASESEFPTAAEAAMGEKAKTAELKAHQAAVQEAAMAQQQAMSETADAFRGVHLDPNEDHWDEMGEEEDDNDFLGGVIEFGDGTQYTIQVSEGAAAPNGVTGQQSSDAPVSKEERFADDFDRSWPKSAGSVVHDDVNSQRRSSTDTSSNVSHSPVSVRDPSQARVLFNERLNRMEPANTRSDKRDQPDPRGRLIDKPDPASAGSQSRVLLMHKAQHPAPPHAHEPIHTSRYPGESRKDDAFESGSTISQSSDEPRRPWGSRDGLPSRPHVPGSSWINGRRDPSNSRETSSVASSLSNDTGRSAWGGRSGPPKPDPRHLHTGREGERQLPPHLQKSPVGGWGEPPWAKRPPEPLQTEPSQPRPEPAALRSPVVETKVLPTAEPPQISVVEEQKPLEESKPEVTEVPAEAPNVNEIQKAVLQDSAERAKRRRQQEEEERLKAQERAKKKAAEVEARMLATASIVPTQKSEPQSGGEQVLPRPSEAQVNKFIEDAISSATSAANAHPLPTDHLPKRTPSYFREGERRPPLTHHDAPSRPQPLHVSDRIDSWRSKPAAEPPRQPSEVKVEEKIPEKPVSFIPAEVHSLEVKAGENLEVVDFSDMGKLVGEDAVHDSDVWKHQQSFIRRPVASDYFEKSRSEIGQWRNTSDHASIAVGSIQVQTVPDTTNANGGIREKATDTPSHKPTSIDLPSHPPEFHGHPSHYPTSPRFPKSPLQTYREAPLSALDDTMSRIRGALDGMQHGKVTGRESTGNSSNEEVTQPTQEKEVPVSQPPVPAKVEPVKVEPVKVEKWLPPAKRLASAIRHQPVRANLDLFAITCFEAPILASSTESPVILLPKNESRKTWIPSKKHPFILKNTTCYVRWDILSFDPPVEGMTKKSLSLNDVLFRKPQGTYKKGFKYTVVIPKPTDIQRQPISTHLHPNMIRVNLVPGISRSLSSSHRFGPSDQSNWRTSRMVSCSSAPEQPSSPPKVELNVTSRSPPPDPSSLRLLDSTSEVSDEVSKVPSGAQASSMKSRGPQMPAGASIAFYRNARGSLDVSTTSRKVSFTVSSELDDSMANGSEIEFPERRVVSLDSVKTVVPPSPDNSDDQDSDRIQSKIVARSIDSVLATTPPPSQPSSNSWAKSPARVPDPEHLKAVWSQTSDKDNVSTVNSLKAIADDLTAVPFSLSDVKSDDGGTPPPAASNPSRMSASEVTKAFQMVPQAPAGVMSPASGRSSLFTPAVTSPMTAAKQLKPMSTGLTHPHPNGVVRPHYSPYPHMAHTPSPPTLMYPHPMAPNGMHHSPSGTPYGQPIWMPMGPPMHPPGAPMMRGQPGAAYTPSLMPYHTPNGTQNGIYPPPPPHPGAQPQAAYPGMPPSQMMVSPVMTHAAPVPPHMMYGASPVMLPVPTPGAPPQPQAYPGAVGVGRAGMPARTPSDTRTPQTASHSVATTSRYSAPSYSQVPPQPYVRPTW